VAECASLLAQSSIYYIYIYINKPLLCGALKARHIFSSWWHTGAHGGADVIHTHTLNGSAGAQGSTGLKVHSLSSAVLRMDRKKGTLCLYFSFHRQASRRRCSYLAEMGGTSRWLQQWARQNTHLHIRFRWSAVSCLLCSVKSASCSMNSGSTRWKSPPLKPKSFYPMQGAGKFSVVLGTSA
jgi:hypothetical protein